MKALKRSKKTRALETSIGAQIKALKRSQKNKSAFKNETQLTRNLITTNKTVTQQNMNQSNSTEINAIATKIEQTNKTKTKHACKPTMTLKKHISVQTTLTTIQVPRNTNHTL